MKRMGVLGGMSAQATMDLEARVHHCAQCLHDDSDASDLVNPAAVLAEAAVRFAIEVPREPTAGDPRPE